jgi:glutathione reductase (NADPH)
MEKDYDIVVIGTGMAGRTFVDKIVPLGLKIAMVDSRKYGDISPPGSCDLKKMFTDITKVTDWNNRMIGKGAGTQNPLKINWPSLIIFKKTLMEECPKKTEGHYIEIGIDTYHGRAHFEDQNTIVIGEDKLRGKYIFLATGSKPRKLNIPGEGYITASEEFMEAEKLPERITFIGGGPISFEFAHIARRAGSDVTILHRSERLLRSFYSDMVNLLIKASEAVGIKILTNRQVISI